MNIDKVFDIFCRLAELDKNNSVRLRFLCEGSVRYVLYRMKNKANAVCGSGRAEFAAAALAYYRYVLLSLTDGNGGSVKIGDISLKQSGFERADAAEKLCRDAFAEITDLIGDNEFVFKGV